MKFKVVLIPVGAFSVEYTDLNDMVEQVCRLSGKKAKVERQLVIETDDQNLSMMFDSFRESLMSKNGNGRHPKTESGKQTRTPKAKKQTTEIGGSSRRIIETGEIYSLVELKKRIQNGEVGNGTVVENKRSERFVVMDGELIKEPKA